MKKLSLEQVSEFYGLLLAGLALLACALLFMMMLMICADVLLRNVPVIAGGRTLAWSNDVAESMLYLITILTAPWLLHRAQHVRVNIVLVAIPKKLAWYCEWLADVLALISCLVMMTYASSAAVASYTAGSMVLRALVTPEWWSLAPLPVVFGLLAIEVLFRMHRLYSAERGPRDDAVSAG